MQVLGIDIGGSGIKGAIVETGSGGLVSERHRIETPQPPTPDAVAAIIAELVAHFHWCGPVGCGFPAAIQHGVARTAANVSRSFMGTNVDALFSEHTQCPCYTLNDADAAGIAEMKFGAGAGHRGVVMLITIGTGLGTAIFNGGALVPNTELGHVYMKDGQEAEHYASAAVRKTEDLRWKEWATRFNEYLHMMESLFWPDLFILGGGASKKFVKFEEQITVATQVKPAAFLNQAGIVGAAVYARSNHRVDGF